MHVLLKLYHFDGIICGSRHKVGTSQAFKKTGCFLLKEVLKQGMKRPVEVLQVRQV